MTATARDLADLAAVWGQPVPLPAAMTILVEILAAVAARHRRGLVHRELFADDVVLGVDSLTTLLADPSRDPKARLTAPVRPLPADGTGAAEDVGAAAAVAVELLVGGGAAELPPTVEPLLRRMLDPRRSARPSAAEAHAEARTVALELFAAEARERRLARLEERLRRALDQRREAAVRELSAKLGSSAPSSSMLGAAEDWLRRLDRDRRAAEAARWRLSAALYGRRRKAVERQAGLLSGLLGETAGDDPDLALARGWLAEERRRRQRRRAVVRRNSLKLALTGMPLVLATLLSGLLLVVMMWAG